MLCFLAGFGASASPALVAQLAQSPEKLGTYEVGFQLAPRLHAAGFSLAPICVVRHARVGLLGEIGSLLRARLALIPFPLEGVGGVDSLNQADGIHPTAAGDRIVADNVWRVLEPLLPGLKVSPTAHRR